MKAERSAVLLRYISSGEQPLCCNARTGEATVTVQVFEIKWTVHGVIFFFFFFICQVYNNYSEAVIGNEILSSQVPSNNK